jgi:hypothetical protein
MALLPTWKDIFNSGHQEWLTVDQIVHAARSAGYPYFSWTSQIWKTPKTGSFPGEPVCHVFDVPVADLPTVNVAPPPDAAKDGDAPF